MAFTALNRYGEIESGPGEEAAQQQPPVASGASGGYNPYMPLTSDTYEKLGASFNEVYGMGVDSSQGIEESVFQSPIARQGDVVASLQGRAPEEPKKPVAAITSEIDAAPVAEGAIEEVAGAMTDTDSFVDSFIGFWESDTGQSIMSQASNLLGTTTQDQKNKAAKNYGAMLRMWKDSRGEYFDPNSDLEPDLDAYLDAMPLETEALNEGQVVSGLHGGESSALGWVLDPAGALIGDEGWLGIDQNQASYMAEESLVGAAEGALSSGWVGAVVGAVIGTITSYFSWEDAEKRDKKKMKEARKEYERQMRKWQYKRYQRIQEQKAVGIEQRRQLAATEKTKREKKKVEGANRRIDRRNYIVGIINELEKQKGEKLAKRLERWGRR